MTARYSCSHLTQIITFYRIDLLKIEVINSYCFFSLTQIHTEIFDVKFMKVINHSLLCHLYNNGQTDDFKGFRLRKIILFMCQFHF